MAKTILITGCSMGGIGDALAQSLAGQGHHVFVTARDTSRISPELRSLFNVSILTLDVSSAVSIADAAEAVRQTGRGLDVLVNNAGVGYTVPVLDLDVEKAKRLYEVNVWGPVRMIQAFSDLIIASQGRIVNVSSVGAVINTPWIAPYASSKAALNNISETLRLELYPLGVSVVTINIGTIATSFHANEPTPELPPTSHYTNTLDTIKKWANGQAGLRSGTATDLVHSLLSDVLDDGRNGIIWRGPYSSSVRLISWLMPTWLLDIMAANGRGLHKLCKDIKAKSD